MKRKLAVIGIAAMVIVGVALAQTQFPLTNPNFLETVDGWTNQNCISAEWDSDGNSDAGSIVMVGDSMCWVDQSVSIQTAVTYTLSAYGKCTDDRQYAVELFNDDDSDSTICDCDGTWGQCVFETSSFVPNGVRLISINDIYGTCAFDNVTLTYEGQVVTPTPTPPVVIGPLDIDLDFDAIMEYVNAILAGLSGLFEVMIAIALGYAVVAKLVRVWRESRA